MCFNAQIEIKQTANGDSGVDPDLSSTIQPCLIRTWVARTLLGQNQGYMNLDGATQRSARLIVDFRDLCCF